MSVLYAELSFARRLASWDNNLLNDELARGLSTLRQITSRPIQDLVSVSDTLPTEERDAMFSLLLRHCYWRVSWSVPELNKEFFLNDQEASTLLKFRQECARQHATGEGQNYTARAYGFDRTGGDMRAYRLDAERRKVAAKWCGDDAGQYLDSTEVISKVV